MADVDQYHRDLMARGVDATAPVYQSYGIREMELTDPDGAPVEDWAAAAGGMIAPAAAAIESRT